MRTKIILGCCAVLATILACSASSETKGAGATSGSGATGGTSTVNLGGGGSGGTTTIGVGGVTEGGASCPTSVSGTIYAPSGTLPLYNVAIYVPSEAVDPLPQGAACHTCDGNFSGRPVAAALSDSAGHFVMNDVPAGDAVPIVIQVGKWRRQITVPVTACQDNPITDPNVTRLPKNQSEGDLPQMAVVRGGSDALECLIRKIGVDDAEFTTDAGSGRVHLYYSDKGDNTPAETGQLMQGGSAVPLTQYESLFVDLPKMMTYDMVLMGCQGADDMPANEAEFTNVRSYTEAGGRMFGSHYWDQWVYYKEFVAACDADPASCPEIVQFMSGFQKLGNVTGTVDTSFPKGVALSEWLNNVGASTTPGQIPIVDSTQTVQSLVHPNAQQWITAPGTSTPAIQYFSFPMPIDGPECGRMVFSELHVNAGSDDSGKLAFPSGCGTGELTPQQKALAFMIFDLSSCVQPEDKEVVPPEIVK